MSCKTIKANRSCPRCQQKASAVSLKTLKNQLKSEFVSEVKQEACFFCAEQSCEWVYFSVSQHWTVSDLKHPVFQKDLAPETLACYCFGYSRGQIQVAARSGKPLSQQIAALTAAGQCACESNNPQGCCCLGNIRQLEND